MACLTTVAQHSMVADAQPSDEELLMAFVERRSQDGFAQLVERHGPMVLGACRRVTRNIHDAEDAFQATFLVLARRAAAVKPGLLANWLYGVALRTALKARAAANRRRVKEQDMAMLPDSVDQTQTVDREVIQSLDAALCKLPAKYRTAVVLCDLEQKSRRESAALLRIPEGTLSSRLATARKLLAAGLRKRGITLSIASLVAVLSRHPRPCPAEILVQATVRSAVRFCLGHTAGLALASNRATTLAEGVLRMMAVKKILIGLLLFVASASLVGVGASVYGDVKARLRVQKALEGVWLVESVEDSGDMREAKGFQVVFKGDRFTFQPPGRKEPEFAGRYEIDPDKGPQMIDFIDAQDGLARHAIFDLKGDELRICMNEDPAGERPDRFVSEKKQGGSNNDLLMILKRKEAKETK
jgi:RNA polymerase sigma factor (sigma-70 family)